MFLVSMDHAEGILQPRETRLDNPFGIPRSVRASMVHPSFVGFVVATGELVVCVRFPPLAGAGHVGELAGHFCLAGHLVCRTGWKLLSHGWELA